VKAKVLESKLKAQGESNNVADDKQAAAHLQKQLSSMKRDVKKEKMKISKADSTLRSKAAQVTAEQAQSKSAVNPTQLEALRSKQQGVKQALKNKQARIASEERRAADTNRASAALQQELKAVDGRLKRVKSVALTEKDKIKSLKTSVDKEKKKYGVLKKVKQSWEQSLVSSRESGKHVKEEKEKAAQELKNANRQSLVAQEKETQVQVGKEHKAIKAEQAAKAVSSELKVSQTERDHVKAKQTKSKEQVEVMQAKMMHESKKLRTSGKGNACSSSQN